MTDKTAISRTSSAAARAICLACARSRLVGTRSACRPAPCLISALVFRQTKGHQ